MLANVEKVTEVGRKHVVGVLLNWNGRQVLPSALTSLLSQDYTDLEIVLVDNASSDESLQWVKQNYPQLAVLHNQKNLGFSGGCNRGIEEALLRNADYVLLLNNDAALDANTLSLMIQEAESDPRIGIVAPAVWRTDAPELLDSAYGVIHFNHVVARRLGISRPMGQGYMTARDVDCVFGAVLLVRSEVFRAAGLFDAEFWMFLEEVEFCYRARQAGFRVRYFPLAAAHHLAGYSIRNARIELMKTYLLRRNSVLFLRKHGNPARWCKFLACAVLSLIFTFLIGTAQLRWEGFWARLRGYVDGFARRSVDPEVLMCRYALRKPTEI